MMDATYQAPGCGWQVEATEDSMVDAMYKEQGCGWR